MSCKKTPKFSSADQRQNSLPISLYPHVQAVRWLLLSSDWVVESLKFNLCFYTYRKHMLLYLNCEKKNQKKKILTLWWCQWSSLLEYNPLYSSLLTWETTMVKKQFITVDTLLNTSLLSQILTDSCLLIDKKVG